jgi:outer membrane protein OmpA-like peptidoglycan-associated protein
MTNKIITILAVCVIALAVLAYNLWHQGEDTLPVSETVPEKSAEQAVKEVRPVKPENKPPLKEIEDSATLVNEEENTADEDEEDKPEKDEKLCQLADTYNDWYPKNGGYESEKFMEDVKSWAFSHGYFETEYSKGSLDIKKQSDYDYYEIDDLEEMAKAGDSMANVRLAYRLYLKGDKENMERAQPYCERAIVDGYTALVMCKTSYLTTKIYEERRKEDQEADAELQRELELEYKAWGNVSGALGDELGSKLTSNMLADEEFEFESETITQRTQAILTDIEQRRQQLGIGEIKHPPVPELLAYVLENEKGSREKLNACFE